METFDTPSSGSVENATQEFEALTASFTVMHADQFEIDKAKGFLSQHPQFKKDFAGKILLDVQLDAASAYLLLEKAIPLAFDYGLDKSDMLAAFSETLDSQWDEEQTKRETVWG